MFAAMKCGKINRELEIAQIKIEKDRISYTHLSFSFKLTSEIHWNLLNLLLYAYGYEFN